MPYPSQGSLTTDQREIAVSETWDTQSDWTAYQSASNVSISNGVVSLVDLTVPSSGDLLARYDFSQEDGTAPVTDQTGNGYDLSGTYSGVGGSINGVQAGQFDGVDDFLSTSTPIQSQPNHVFMTVRVDDPTGGNVGEDVDIFDSEANDATQLMGQANEVREWRAYAGSGIEGGPEDTDNHVFGVRFDGQNSNIRLDGTQVVSGGAGTAGLDGISLGGIQRSASKGFDGVLGEVLVYPQDMSASVADIEQYLSDKWGIALS